MKLLADVAHRLGLRSVGHALIGAGALAIHGVSRSTFDLDLLVVDPIVLEDTFWDEFPGSGLSVDARRGDLEDPLAGVVRLEVSGSRAVDLVVGRHAWQRRAIERAQPAAVGDAQLPVVRAADLVLLKLFAGGPQDAWDIASLLAVSEDRSALVSTVERDLVDLPPECAETWRRILAN